MTIKLLLPYAVDRMMTVYVPGIRVVAAEFLRSFSVRLPRPVVLWTLDSIQDPVVVWGSTIRGEDVYRWTGDFDGTVAIFTVNGDWYR